FSGHLANRPSRDIELGTVAAFIEDSLRRPALDIQIVEETSIVEIFGLEALQRQLSIFELPSQPRLGSLIVLEGGLEGSPRIRNRFLAIRVEIDADDADCAEQNDCPEYRKADRKPRGNSQNSLLARFLRCRSSHSGRIGRERWNIGHKRHPWW